MLALVSAFAIALMSTAALATSPPPCDCYVDLNGEYSYINMWKGYPCSGRSLGALYQDRCLYYLYDDNGDIIEEDAECYGNYYTYYKMRTESGKSRGWVASDFLDCNYGPLPPPAPAPAALASAKPSDEFP